MSFPGVAVIGGIGGNCNDPKLVATCELALADMAAAGVDGVYVGEPGGAPVSVDPSRNSMSPASINYVVSTFNPLIDYFRARRPGAHFGFTLGDAGSVAMHEALLAAGLKADFASMEEYGGAQIDVWAGKAQYPNVKTMILAYNTLALCRGDHGLANVSTDAGGDVDIWGFWDLVYPNACTVTGITSGAASRDSGAFEAALSAPIALGFGLPTTMRRVPPRSWATLPSRRALSNRRAQHSRPAWRSTEPGILPIWTSRHSPSGALSPLRCRREPTPTPLGQGLCRASDQSFLDA